jgi:hypothetical protein
MDEQEYQSGLKYLKFRVREARAHLGDNEREIERLIEKRKHLEANIQFYEVRLGDFIENNAPQTG